jgi:hypothetical protein
VSYMMNSVLCTLQCFYACYSRFLHATVFSSCSLVCFLSGAQRDVCSGLLSGAQRDMLVSSTSCSRSSGRVKILQGTNKGSCTLWSRLGREERHWSASKGAKPEVL